MAWTVDTHTSMIREHNIPVAKDASSQVWYCNNKSSKMIIQAITIQISMQLTWWNIIFSVHKFFGVSEISLHIHAHTYLQSVFLFLAIVKNTISQIIWSHWWIFVYFYLSQEYFKDVIEVWWSLQSIFIYFFHVAYFFTFSDVHFLVWQNEINFTYIFHCPFILCQEPY